MTAADDSRPSTLNPIPTEHLQLPRCRPAGYRVLRLRPNVQAQLKLVLAEELVEQLAAQRGIGRRRIGLRIMLQQHSTPGW